MFRVSLTSFIEDKSDEKVAILVFSLASFRLAKNI